MTKCIAVGITGCVAAFKSVQLVSDLVKKGYDVEVLMTKNATEFIKPLQFEALTKHKVMVDTFDRNFTYSTQHISLAKKADCMIVVPATANFIAKAVHGICDDMLTTSFLSCNCPKLIAPAMNTNMYLNPVTQDNLKLCEKYGFSLISPISGNLACGDTGIGKLADLDDIMDAIEEALVVDKPLKGKNVLINAGPTLERIDPVRYISNHSTGKMGYALARNARNMGANVTLVSGPTNLKALRNVKLIQVESAKEMFDAMMKVYDEQDFVICSAAVSDFTPKVVSSQKIKKGNDQLSLELTKTQDILKYLGEHKTKQILCGFAMETENEFENAQKKCISKNCDLLVLNSLNQEGAGFGCDTNIATLFTKDSYQQYELMSKDELSRIILKQLEELYASRI